MVEYAPTQNELYELVRLSTAINIEIFYWWCITLMVLIHAGFLSYEMGASRVKHTLSSAVKNILAFAFIIPTCYFVGWWIYHAMPAGITPDYAAGANYLPWSKTMGPNLADHTSGVLWAVFALFAATTASILSGAVIERVRIAGFLVLSIFLGSFIWVLAAAWSWHPDAWLLLKFGFHDFGAAGCIHIIAGFFALGVLINIGPRIGRFDVDGTVNSISGHSLPMSTFGIMLIIVGFFGFLGACIIANPEGQWTSITGTPTTLSAIAFNTLMAFSGGIIGAYVVTRQPFWMMSGGLAGIIAASPGMDLYYPPIAFLVAFIASMLVPSIDDLLMDRFKIDDAVGAFSVHGASGFCGLIALGIFASGYPNVVEGTPEVNLFGQFVGAVLLSSMGFISGYLGSLGLKKLNMLRVPAEAELKGLDTVKMSLAAYPKEVESKPGTMM